MTINFRTTSHSRVRTIAILALVAAAASIVEVSAHRVIGRHYPALATALVQSPTASPKDLPVPIFATGLSVICFKVSNTSTIDTRITAVGLELPGDLSGFALVSPVNGGLRLRENVGPVPEFPNVMLDLVVTTDATTTGGRPNGLAPNAPPALICISGPFDPTIPIETMLNGVFVKFEHASGTGTDIGVWERRP